MRLTAFSLACFIGLALIETVLSFQGIPGIYCGLDDCYEILGATRESNKSDIHKLYKKLAVKWHPDRARTVEDKAIAQDKFRAVAQAYEVLKDDDTRKDYNDMMDDPEHYYRHYYRYYRRAYSKVDARLVIICTILVISGLQYWVGQYRYNEAINYFVTVPKYRFKAQDIAKQKGLLPINEKHFAAQDKSDKKEKDKKSRHRSKDEIRSAEEAVIRQIIENNMDIRGGLAKPDVKNILLIQIFLLPWSLYQFIRWYVRWIWLFDIMKQPYGREEQIYLICKYFKMNLDQLETNEDIESLLRQELYVKDKFLKWKLKRDDEMKSKLLESSNYKRMKRYMKKGGPGQITFLDD